MMSFRSYEKLLTGSYVSFSMTRMYSSLRQPVRLHNVCARLIDSYRRRRPAKPRTELRRNCRAAASQGLPTLSSTALRHKMLLSFDRDPRVKENCAETQTCSDSPRPEMDQSPSSRTNVARQSHALQRA